MTLPPDLLPFVTGAAALLAIPAFMGVRTDWVLRQRLRLLHLDFEAYERLPSFDGMMWRFWIWDINRFIR